MQFPTLINKWLGGDLNSKALRAIEPVVPKINAFEESISALSDEALKAKTEEFKARLTDGATLDDLLPEAFAVVREASKRVLNMRHFDVQLIGGIALHRGKISEMRTGEGKTLVATLPVYLNALTGKGVHVVTVNDYLARRDAEWMGQLYEFLGLSVGIVVSQMSPFEKRAAYAADVTYATNNELGFDYLRDNMAANPEGLVQRGLNYAIVDEIDSILIDEARTPLIISAPDVESTEHYKRFASVVPSLTLEVDYIVDEKLKAITLTDEGIERIEKMLGIKDIYESGDVTLAHHVEQSIKAYALYHKDKEYVVQNGEILIVDEFTGRMMPGRRYSEGLHQAIEAKEGVDVKQESKTLATITFQNLFRLYDKLGGMTGTAKTEEEEFYKIYGLEVVVIPTNKSIARTDLDDLIYINEDAKFGAVIRDIEERHKKGQPVLVGTIAIEKSEKLSDMLKVTGIPHEVLNAKQHEREAEIISLAGQKGAVTIATNMAGRGTDIKLGEGVADCGGLHVLGTERHESRRIDNQLRGRSGRQGDPGSSQFFVSLEDDLMRLFGSDRMKRVMQSTGVGIDTPLQHRWISSSLEGAQKRVEGFNFDMRKRVLEYDDVMNRHREVIYGLRHQILNQENLKDRVWEYVKDDLAALVSFHTVSGEMATDELFKHLEAIFDLTPEDKEKMKKARDAQHLTDILVAIAEAKYEAREEEFGSEAMREVERALLLRVMDVLWMEHIDAMMRLREAIGLRGYAQRDPLVEYKQESYQMFNRLLASIKNDLTRSIYKVQLILKEEPAVRPGSSVMNNPHLEPGLAEEGAMLENPDALAQPGELPWPQDIDPSKVGRNDACPCGSGLKFKKCHGLVFGN
jgi:preprotein translocase subunit SecA